jgi:phosphoribosylpyrophosphate synthetase
MVDESFANAKHIMLTPMNGISLYSKIQEMLDGYSFHVDDLKKITQNFDDGSNKIFLYNPDKNGFQKEFNNLDFTNYDGKVVYACTIMSKDKISVVEQKENQIRMLHNATKWGAEVRVALNPYHFYSRADHDSLELRALYYSGNNITEKEKEQIIQRSNSTDDLELYINQMLTAGAQHIISVDLHNEADVLKFAKNANDRFSLSLNMNNFLFNLDTTSLFVNHIKNDLSKMTGQEIKPEDIVWASTDEGSENTTKRALELYNDSGSGAIFCKKVKKENRYGSEKYTVIDSVLNVNNVKEKTIVITDDCAGTFDTIINTIKVICENYGKPKYVIAAISNPTIYSDSAFDKIIDGRINVLTLNTRSNMAYHSEKPFKQISVFDISPYIYSVMTKCFGDPKNGIIPLNEIFNFNSNNLTDTRKLYNLGPNHKHTQKQLIPYNN